MIYLKKQLIVLFIISILLILTAILCGCSSTDLDDPILYLISGYVVDAVSQQPLDSVKVTVNRDGNVSNFGFSDTTGFFGIGAVGHFHEQFEILLLFEKDGHISRDTTVTITKQLEIIDSLIIYLNSQ